MTGSSFGKLFKVTIWGESHGPAVGMVLEGCPAGLKIDIADVQRELNRRRPGQSSITTNREEKDQVIFLSGLFEEITTGAPISAMVENKDQRSQDYEHLEKSYRPSHADFTYQEKYGLRDYRGGGRSSARETVGRVIAGSIAKQFLKTFGIEIIAWASQIGEIVMPDQDQKEISYEQVESNIVRCPDIKTAKKMQKLIEQVRSEGDTIGGIISCRIKGVPSGLGEPVFDKLHADLGKAMLSINAVKGFEYGKGFSCVSLKGSEHNDIFIFDQESKKIKTEKNDSGGIQGGISNGMDINFRVAFKPVSTLMKVQRSIDDEGKEKEIKGKGRHDPCVIPRAIPIVEAMAALTLADHILRNRSSKL